MHDNARRSIYEAKQSVLGRIAGWLARACTPQTASWQTSCAGTPRGGEYFTRIYVAFHAANTAVV